MSSDTYDRTSAQKHLKKKAALLSLLGCRLAEAGAETRLIICSLSSIGDKIQVLRPEYVVTKSFVFVKVYDEFGHAESVLRTIKVLGINMDTVTQLHQIVLDVQSSKEEPNLYTLNSLIRTTKGHSYPKWLLVLIESVAAGLFAYLNGGGPLVMVAAFLGGIALMSARFIIIKKGYFEAAAFTAAAFTGCVVAFLVSHYGLSLSYHEQTLAVMATSLLLVPGFPFMNGFLDVFKGYIETGITRLFASTVLIAAAAIGLVGALYFVKMPL